MRILIICATPAEAGFSQLAEMPEAGSAYGLPHSVHILELLITGVGMVATTYHLGRQLMNHHYDLAINIGICGAFDKNLIGKVVNVRQDCFADFGAEEDEDFLDIFQTGLVKGNDFPFTNGGLNAFPTIKNDVLDNLPEVKGITVNKTSGNERSIYKLKNKYQADVESMEGAAFLYCCNMNNIPCLQIRAVSNLIEKRNREAWKIAEALINLNAVGIELINSL